VPTLEELLSEYLPNEGRAIDQGLRAAGFGLLGTRRGRLAEGIGRAGLLGMTVFDRDMANQAARAEEKLKLRTYLQNQQAAEAAARQQQEALGALAGMPTGQPTVPGPTAPFRQPGGADALMRRELENLPYRPGPAEFESMPHSPGPPDVQQLPTQRSAPPGDPAAKKMAEADYMEGVFRKTLNPTALAMAQKLREDAMKMRDENQGFETVIGPDGTPKIVQRRKFGPPQEMPYAPKPDITMQDLGGSVQAIDKLLTKGGQTFTKTMAPAELDTSKRGWAQYGLNKNADARAATASKEGSWTNDLESGVQINNRTGETRPITEGGQPRGSKADVKATASAAKVMNIIAEAEKYIRGATGSYIGAAADLVAGAAGYSPEGATNIARLKAIQGALMLNQPRMEGPQGVLDVKLYEQMAGRIGDPTVPRPQKLAAIEVIKAMNQQYAGGARGTPGRGNVVDFSELGK